MKLALTNCPPAQADQIARTLVEERLVACVNAHAVRSVYRWQGAVEQADEIMLIMKAPAEGLERLRERLVELHPYELPEFVVLDVDREASLPAYLAWVRAEGTPRDP
ncbi:MAG: divalent-cation tolerance protein CutA [Polyangiaceae bacterium]|jgi:periplasmic divalent cation tolerance protein|nr:divalent-cation tolerance protein CutA [Polyangiaceae bacterium]